jgi:putative transcriptional regulator
VRLADPNISHALLIGTAHYRHLPDLPAVANNLTGLAETLRDDYLWGLPADNCRVLLDPVNTREVDLALAEASASARPGGLLLVYLAGHGLIDTETRGLCLAIPETEDRAVHATAVPYDWVRRNVRRSVAEHRVVILDCCYAGRAEMAHPAAGAHELADSATIERTCLLVAASGNEVAQAPPGQPYTAFTGQLIELLRTGLSTGPRLLDVKTVWEQLRERLAAQGFPRPEIQARNAGDRVPLVRNAALRTGNLAGELLVSSSQVTSPDLRRAVVLILRYDPERGAVGLRVNAPTHQPAHDVAGGWESLIRAPAVVFNGGPVAHDGLIPLARLRPGAAPPVQFRPVNDRLGTIQLTGQRSAAESALYEVRLFSGYLGWRAGELEADLAAGLFRRVHASATAVVFAPRPVEHWDELWHELWYELHPRYIS